MNARTLFSFSSTRHAPIFLRTQGMILIFQVSLLCLFEGVAWGADGPKVVEIHAKRYEFTPNEVKLKKGVPVILRLSTQDRSHGFNAPDLKLRADILPGKPTEITLTPAKSGTYDFFCDVFCGSGHEGMSGKFVVSE